MVSESGGADHKTALRELEAARATFVAAEIGVWWGLLCLHVDDGLFLGDPNDRRFQELKNQLGVLFKLKEWKRISFIFLGVDLEEREEPGFWDSMANYVRSIKKLEVEKKSPAEPLTSKEVTCYRQLVMRLRWPAQQTMPHLLYWTRSLAQRVKQATYADYAEGVAEADAGRTRLFHPKIRGELYGVIFDASLRKERDGKAQIGGIHFLTHKEIRNGPQLAAPLEYHTGSHTCGQVIYGCRKQFNVGGY